jgi:hypothetical protein
LVYIWDLPVEFEFFHIWWLRIEVDKQSLEWSESIQWSAWWQMVMNLIDNFRSRFQTDTWRIELTNFLNL